MNVSFREVAGCSSLLIVLGIGDKWGWIKSRKLLKIGILIRKRNSKASMSMIIPRKSILMHGKVRAM
jgi:hypothetical protein